MDTIQKLERIIENMKLVPDTHFDMSKWSCGTVCCAFGASRNDEDFYALDLRWGLSVKRNSFYPVYCGEAGFSAITLFLGISQYDCYYLFNPLEYEEEFGTSNPSKDAVIDRIQNYINTLKNEKAS